MMHIAGRKDDNIVMLHWDPRLHVIIFFKLAIDAMGLDKRQFKKDVRII